MTLPSAGEWIVVVDALGYKDECGDGSIKYAARGERVELSVAEYERHMASVNGVDVFPPIAKPGSRAAEELGSGRFDPLSLVPVTPGAPISMETANALAQQHLRNLHGIDSRPYFEPAGEPSDAGPVAGQDYSALKKDELHQLAAERGIEGYLGLKKDELVAKLHEADVGITPRVGAEREAG